MKKLYSRICSDLTRSENKEAAENNKRYHKYEGYRSLVHVDVLDRFVVSGLILMNTIASGILMNITTSIAYGMREIAAEDLLQSRYLKDQRATMGSIIGLGGSLIFGIAAIAVGFLADHIGLLQTMLLMQPALLLSSFFFYRGINR